MKALFEIKSGPFYFIKPIMIIALFFFVTTAGAARAAIPSPTESKAVIQVNSMDDVISSTDGKCTLREAIIAANTDTASGSVAGECPAGSGADSINMPAGEYLFAITGTGEDAAATGDLDILEDLTLIGEGTACASPGPNCTKIHAQSFDRVFEIHEEAQVVMNSLAIYGGADSGYGGGGVYNRGNLTLSQVIFVGNYSSAYGSGLANNGTVLLNRVGFGPHISMRGGAILNTGLLVADRLSIMAGDALWDGGGLYNEGTAHLTRVHFSYCEAENGAAIFNSRSLVIDQATIQNNSAIENGGGIYHDPAFVTSTFTMTNTTLSGNSAGGDGGAFYSGGLDAYMTNVTIKDNSAGGAGEDINIGAFPSSLNIKNSIVANGAGVESCAGNIISGGHNIDSGTTCGFTQATDLSGVDPLLAALDYGGADLDTHALLPGSPAIDAGDNEACPAADARGILRPKDGNDDGQAICDIGAYELYSPALSVADIQVPEGNVGETYAVFTVSLNDISFEEVKVDYQTTTGTADDSDFDDLSGTLTFPVGTTSQTVTVPVYVDTDPEDDEYFFLTLSNPVNASLAVSQARCTILNDESYSLFLPILRR